MCVYKMNLISAEGYKNAGVNILKLETTDELWIKIKDVGGGLGVKNISDFVLKEMAFMKKTKKQKKKLNATKWLKKNFLKSFIT